MKHAKVPLLNFMIKLHWWMLINWD